MKNLSRQNIFTYIGLYFLLPFESPIFTKGGGGTYSGFGSEEFLDIT